MNSNNNKPGKNKNIKFYIIYFLSVLVMVTVINIFADDLRNK
jgi:cell division protease FtsH